MCIGGSSSFVLITVNSCSCVCRLLFWSRSFFFSSFTFPQVRRTRSKSSSIPYKALHENALIGKIKGIIKNFFTKPLLKPVTNQSIDRLKSAVLPECPSAVFVWPILPHPTTFYHGRGMHPESRYCLLVWIGKQQAPSYRAGDPSVSQHDVSDSFSEQLAFPRASWKFSSRQMIA